MQEDYTVRIDAFQGPLDLLLYLIRRAEVDITDIPIKEIANQYLAFLKDTALIDIDAAGDFLVMAATLMEIKSRLLMPPLPAGEADAPQDSDIHAAAGLDQADPRYELVRQLLEYKKFRDAAHELDEKRLEWERKFPLTASRISNPSDPPSKESDQQDSPHHEIDPDDPPPGPPPVDLEDLSVWDLAQVFQRIIAAIDFGRFGPHQIEADDTPIELHQEDLLDQLNRTNNKSLSLRAVFQGRPRVEAIGLFLATLELVRQRRIRVRQDRLHDDILLEPAPSESESDSDSDEGQMPPPGAEIELKPHQ